MGMGNPLQVCMGTGHSFMTHNKPIPVPAVVEKLNDFSNQSSKPTTTQMDCFVHIFVNTKYLAKYEREKEIT